MMGLSYNDIKWEYPKMIQDGGFDTENYDNSLELRVPHLQTNQYDL